MADLASILNDPNYINANAETKRAIFDKWAPQDPNYAGANEATKQAIQSRFGIAAPPPAAPSEIPKGRSEAGAMTTLGRGLASLADVTAGGIIPAVAQQVAYPVARAFGQSPEQAGRTTERIVGAVDKPFGKAFGVTDTPEYKTETSRMLMDFIGANINKGAGWISQQTGVPAADVANMIGTATLAAPAGAQAAAPVVRQGLGLAADAAGAVKQAAGTAVDAAAASRAGQAVLAPIQKRQADIQARNVASSYANAPKIEAAQTANRLGVALNPAESNPTAGNRLRTAVAGDRDVNASLAAANQPKWTALVKDDLGVPLEGRLDAAAVEKALDVAGKPYDAVRAIPRMEPSPEILAAVEELNKPATIGGKARADAVSGLVTETVDALKEGRSGAQIIDDIRQLRRDAQSTYKSRDKGNNPPPADVAAADAKMAIANALERMVDEHAPSPSVLTEFQQARTRMAQIYDHERAIDFSTNTIDPKVYAKLLDERKGNMTGLGADIGRVAANFPGIAETGAKGQAPLRQAITRYGIGGTVGFGLGSLVGQPVAGAVVGAGVGKVASGIAAKRRATPEYQTAHAVPPDYRPTNNLSPAEIRYGQNQLAPYDWAQR